MTKTVNASLRFRLALFVVGLVVAIGLLGSVAAWTWRLIVRLQTEYETIQSESSSLGVAFKKRLLDLELRLGLYRQEQTSESRERLFAEGRGLRDWISNNLERATSPEARRVMAQAKQFARDYATNALMYLAVLEQSSDAAVEAAALARVTDEIGRLQALDAQLTDDQFEVTQTLVLRTRNVLDLLRELLVVSLLLLSILGAALARVTYRDWIAPLRAKLVQREAIIERQEKLSALGVLAAGIAHEIRNPITSIKARLYMQRKSLAPDSPEGDDNQVIGDEILRLEKTVKDFLDFARPAKPAPVVTAASEPLHEVAKLMAPGLPDPKVRIEVQIVRDSSIEVDPHQLKQVLINLVRNALESLADGGRVTLRADRRFDRRVYPGGACAVLEVADNGQGIPPEVQRRLFDPFFTTKETGTGLGLSIAARIVQQHHGALEYQTQLNRGTTFRILLPTVAPHGKARQNPVA